MGNLFAVEIGKETLTDLARSVNCISEEQIQMTQACDKKMSHVRDN